nr:reverse transcriptase domain-containing protein [Tanacetum cinerariifolium]
MQKYGVTHRLATPYHLQTSGQVEVSNCGLKRILERAIGENRTSWSDKLDDALWLFRTAYKTPIECTSYKLVYEKACHFPVELEHKAYWALKHANFDLKTARDHKKIQINKLNELYDQAYENSLIYKEKTKRIHDSKIKNRVFNIGDRVLLFNSRMKIFSGKLKSRWSGPFTISQVFPYGAVELSQPDGPNFKVNGHHFKHYFGEDIPKKYRSPIMWTEVGEGHLIGPEVKPFEFSVGEHVLLKVSHWKGVVRFGKKKKSVPRFVGPFEITKRISPVAYRLRLPEELNGLHDTFHVSNLKKCLADPTLQVPLDEIRVNAKLNFMEEPMEILEREFKKLKRSRIAIVKVWNTLPVLDFEGSWDVHLSLVELSYNNSYHSSVRCAPFESLYGRKYRSPIMWTEVGEGHLIGPEVKPFEFSVGEHVLLKVSHWKGVVRFGKKEKSVPRFVGPFEITKRISPVAYRLRLPEELNGVHDTFHVSNLKKCLADPTLQVHLDEIRVNAKLNFMEEPMEILEREFKKLKRSRIAIVKVWWNSKRGPEFTWEREDQIKLKYSHLFSSSSS